MRTGDRLDRGALLAVEPLEARCLLAFSVLGSPPTVTVQNQNVNSEDSVDAYLYTAHDTGTLAISAYFNPTEGDIDIQVSDTNGNQIATGAESQVIPVVLNAESLVMPVVQGQRYLIQVIGDEVEEFIGYDLEVENFPAPIPDAVILDPADDTGASNIDQVTQGITQVHFFIQADLEAMEAADISILGPGNIIGGVSDSPGAAVEVFVNGESAGYATVVPDTNFTLFEAFVNPELDRFSTGGPNAAGPAGYAGWTNFISAAVRIFDAQPSGDEVPVFDVDGRTLLSDPLRIIFDNIGPGTFGAPDLLPSSDSGTSNSDNITNISQPAFGGAGEANTRVYIFANGALVGEGVVSSSSELGEGLGFWEVTTEPLVDGDYEITSLFIDLAGNASSFSEATTITVDTAPNGAPQRPTLDLVDFYDSGWSDKDNVTRFTTLNFWLSAEAGTRVVIKDGETVIRTIDPMPAVPFFTVTINPGDYPNGPEGPHPLSAEAFDVAGNRSAQSEELLVTIDSDGPNQPSAPDLLASSDTGTFNDDNVTRLQALAFTGTAEANSRVRIYANGLLVGQGIVGTDQDPDPPNSEDPPLGFWEITTEPLVGDLYDPDGTYDITVEVEDQAGNVSEFSEELTVWVDAVAPNTPYLDLTDASDTGRSNYDNITLDNTPTVTVTADDVAAAGLNNFPHEIRFRIFDRDGSGPDVLVFDSFVDLIPAGFTTDNFFDDITLPTLADGVHNLKLEVEDLAGNKSHAFLLQVTIDTMAPPVWFGLPTVVFDGLDPASDSGVVGNQPTFTDRITNVTAPGFFGTAEANSIVRLAAETFDSSVLIGLDVAIPLDGNFAFPMGRWDLLSSVYLNDPLNFPHDGVRSLFLTAEDVAGNVSDEELLEIFLDTQGPQVTDVSITDFPGFNLFGLKPNNAAQGPTPLVFSLTIDIRDLPNQAAAFLRDAIDEDVALTQGIFSLVGDHNGTIDISQIVVTNDPPVAGQVATATIELRFDVPLPDDRFTLTIHDTLPDIAGNKLDGESNAVQPNGFPQFPSGDGQPGGDFVARFTVDSRAEIGAYADASVFVDTNGNFLADPQGTNNDFTNRDLTYELGIVQSLQGVVSPMGIHDAVFAGNFPSSVRNEGILFADGFDKLAAYGFDPIAGGFRWLVDTNNDGIIDPADGDFATKQPAGFQINGLPVAGNFDGNTTNGDEIGLFAGTKWYFDTNHNFIIDGGDLVVNTSLRGRPIVGDFNGDDIEDLATWKDDQFFFNLGTQPGGVGTQPAWSGAINQVINWGFPGVSELPVAGDMDGDGIDDIGLWVPNHTGTLPISSGNWYFLISNDYNEELRGGNQVTALNHPFSPAPLGNDMFAQFGDAFGLPLVGNFDPPVAAPSAVAPIELAPLLGDTLLGAQSVNGEKWYSVELLRSGSLALEVTSTSGTLTAEVYGADFAPLAAPAVGSNMPVTAGQTYMIRLSGTNAQGDVRIVNHVADTDRLDSTRDGKVSPFDALRIINAILASGTHATPLVGSDPHLYYDTNLDGRISPADVLQVVNHILARNAEVGAAPLTVLASSGSDAPGGEPNAVVFALAASGESSGLTVVPSGAAATVDAVYAELDDAPLTDEPSALLVAPAASASSAVAGVSHAAASDAAWLDEDLDSDDLL